MSPGGWTPFSGPPASPSPAAPAAHTVCPPSLCSHQDHRALRQWPAHIGPILLCPLRVNRGGSRLLYVDKSINVYMIESNRSIPDLMDFSLDKVSNSPAFTSDRLMESLGVWVGLGELRLWKKKMQILMNIWIIVLFYLFCFKYLKFTFLFSYII